MSQYNKCLQIVFIGLQLLLIAFGAVLIGVGVWVAFKVDPASYQAVISGAQFKAAPYVIVASGCVVIAVSALGMFGACCGTIVNRILLGLYMVVTLCILGLQLAGGIVGFVYREKVSSVVKDRISNITTTFNATSDNPDAKAIALAWNLVQKNLQCCGINNASDWKTQPLPNSCCKSCSSASFIPFTSSQNCSTPVGCNGAADVYSVGCQEALINFFYKYLIIIAAIAIAFIISEVVVVLMACCLLCCSKSEK